MEHRRCTSRWPSMEERLEGVEESRMERGDVLFAAPLSTLRSADHWLRLRPRPLLGGQNDGGSGPAWQHQQGSCTTHHLLLHLSTQLH